LIALGADGRTGTAKVMAAWETVRRVGASDCSRAAAGGRGFRGVRGAGGSTKSRLAAPVLAAIAGGDRPDRGGSRPGPRRRRAWRGCAIFVGNDSGADAFGGRRPGCPNAGAVRGRRRRQNTRRRGKAGGGGGGMAGRPIMVDLGGRGTQLAAVGTLLAWTRVGAGDGPAPRMAGLNCSYERLCVALHDAGDAGAAR